MKYLFACRFSDGSRYFQRADDVSLTNDKKSAFFDVMDKDIVRFWIDGDGHHIVVDLTDGHFDVDGASFKLHDDEGLKNFRLIYYRRITAKFSGTEEVERETEFCIGWQTNGKFGENIKRILMIK